MTNKRVLVIAGVGSNNIGDDAMLLGVINDIEKHLPGAEVRIFVENPADCEYLRAYIKYPLVKSINDYFKPYSPKKYDRFLKYIFPPWVLKAKRLIARGERLVNNMDRLQMLPDVPAYVRNAVDQFKWAELVIDVGGANLNEIWKTYFYEKCFNFLLAGKAGRRLILSGQSVEPMSLEPDRTLLTKALNAATLITTRERISEDYIRSLGVKSKVMTTGDDALNLPLPATERIDQIFKKEGLDLSGKYIGFQFRDYIDLKNEQVYEQLAVIIDHAIEATGANLVCIPFHYRISDERVDVGKVIQHSKKKDRISIVTGHYDPVEIKGIMSRMYSNIGTSYHFYVYSASLGIPVLPVYNGPHYTQKFLGLTELFGMQEYHINLNEGNVNTWLDQTAAFCKAHDMIATDLRIKRDVLLEQITESRKVW